MTRRTHRTHRTVAALFAGAVAMLIASGCDQNAVDAGAGGEGDDPDVLIFAAVPSYRVATLLQSHQPIVEMLKKETGKEVLFQTGTDYATITEGLRDGKIDIAALGLRARQAAGCPDHCGGCPGV